MYLKQSQYSVCYLQGQVKMEVSLVSFRKLASQERVSDEKRVAVKPLLDFQCTPMTHETNYFTLALEV